MRIVRTLESFPPDARPSVVALGVFDGVHLAHRAILDTAVARARRDGGTAVACTFDPHPAEVLQPDRAPLPITTLDERLELIAMSGVGLTVVAPFTPALASMEPETFVADVLAGRLGAREVVVGAARMLGRPYFVSGDIVEGAGRGRSLGFATANVAMGRPLLTPPGVYACRFKLGEVIHGAVVNAGVRPTFGETVFTVEAHVLDFEGNLYRRRVRLDFVASLREERKFPDIEALKAQIAADVAAARAALSG